MHPEIKSFWWWRMRWCYIGAFTPSPSLLILMKSAYISHKMERTIQLISIIGVSCMNVLESTVRLKTLLRKICKETHLRQQKANEIQDIIDSIVNVIIITNFGNYHWGHGFETTFQLMKQFAHSCHLPGCQYPETYSYVSSIQNNVYTPVPSVRSPVVVLLWAVKGVSEIHMSWFRNHALILEAIQSFPGCKGTCVCLCAPVYACVLNNVCMYVYGGRDKLHGWVNRLILKFM